MGWGKKVAPLTTATLGFIGGAFVTQNAIFQREEREKSTLIRLTWQENIGRDSKGQLLQGPTDSVGKSMRTFETPASSSSKLRLREMNDGDNRLQHTEKAETAKCGPPKEPENKCSKCGPKKEPENKCSMKLEEPPKKCGPKKEPENKCSMKAAEPPKKCCPPKEPEKKCSMKVAEPPKKCCPPKEPENECSMKAAEPPKKRCPPKEPENKCSMKAAEPPKKCGPKKEPENKCSMKAAEPPKKCCPPKEPENKCSMKAAETPKCSKCQQPKTDQCCNRKETCSPVPETPGEKGIKCAQSKYKLRN